MLKFEAVDISFETLLYPLFLYREDSRQLYIVDCPKNNGMHYVPLRVIHRMKRLNEYEIRFSLQQPKKKKSISIFNSNSIDLNFPLITINPTGFHIHVMSLNSRSDNIKVTLSYLFTLTCVPSQLVYKFPSAITVETTHFTRPLVLRQSYQFEIFAEKYSKRCKTIPAMRQIASFLSLQGDFELRKKKEKNRNDQMLRGQRRIYLCDPVVLITKPCM